jgi:hypothetical protein
MRPARAFAKLPALWCGASLCLLAALTQVQAQARADGPSAGIYSCITPEGRRLTSDRPIAECTAREQRVLNSDGSLRYVLPPSMTAEERAQKDARDREVAAQIAARNDAIRRDRNLRNRYPDEEAHGKSREAALDTVRLAMEASAKRLSDLAAERKPLLNEMEFYAGRQLPAKLRQQLDANDAAVMAQRSSMQNQEAELARINRLYDAELQQLRRLWAGAQPGTLGPLPAVEPVLASGNKGKRPAP